MTWLEAIDAIRDRPAVGRMRELCDDSNTDDEQREEWRAYVVRLATGELPPQVIEPDERVGPFDPCCGGAPLPP